MTLKEMPYPLIHLRIDARDEQTEKNFMTTIIKNLENIKNKIKKQVHEETKDEHSLAFRVLHLNFYGVDSKYIISSNLSVMLHFDDKAAFSLINFDSIKNTFLEEFDQEHFRIDSISLEFACDENGKKVDLI